MVRYEDLSPNMVSKLKANDVIWDENKRVYVTKLHKQFLLRESEAKSKEHLEEFCSLVQYLKGHLEYGVSTEWGDSELNKYVYKLNKEELKNQFPLTINALFRFYLDSDIRAFYKKTLNTKDPTIIDLIGTTGAGKTTFCQQFVNDEGKAILEKTITSSGNSTIIQTDIVVLENTKSRLFLKARTKSDIMRDVILVALNLDTRYLFDTKKSIAEAYNKQGLKKDKKKEIKIESEIFQGVYNLFRNQELIKSFQEIAKELQEDLENQQGGIEEYISANMKNTKLSIFLDDIINKEFEITDFYGYRHEIPLNKKYILEKTVIPTKNYNKLKEKDVEFLNVISYRILFEQAILVLQCDEIANQKLPDKFIKGIVFRDSQGHKKSEQVGIATDFEVKNKILLIPANTSGELIDDKYLEELKNIVISEPKQNIIVITKIDSASSYVKYKDGDYIGFIEDLKEQVVTTHNNLIEKLEETEKPESDQAYKLDENTMIKKFIASFDNAYLSKITKDKNGKFDAEVLRIICEDKSSEEITVSDIKDVTHPENWYALIESILESETTVSYDDASLKVKNEKNRNDKNLLISKLANNVNQLLDVCINKADNKNDLIKWDKDLERALSLYLIDFRSIYNECYMWHSRSIKRDINTSAYSIKDKVEKLIDDINSLITVSKGENAVEVMLENKLSTYLNATYSFDKRLDVVKISNRIISNAIGRAVMASYKIFDRDITANEYSTNIQAIYNDPRCIKPLKVAESYGVYDRNYYTDTAYFLGVYCYLLSKFKCNLETYFIGLFKSAIESELDKLDDKVK